MVKNNRVFELKIEEDDELSGIDSISLVDEPAIEIGWMAFNRIKGEDFHIPDGEDEKYLEKLVSIAQDEQELFDEGWVVNKIQIVGESEFVSTNPNGPSEEDEKEYNVRYKYILNPKISQSAIIPTTRDFCKTLINRNYVWRIEDMDSTQNDFGQSAMVWRGGYNCRHVWARIEYKKDATIINKASVNKGKVTVGGFPNDLIPDIRVLGIEQPNTTTSATLANPSPSTVRNLGLSKQGFEVGVPHYTEDGKLYIGPTHKDADGRLMTGEVHTKDSVYLYHKNELGYDNGLPSYVDQVSGDTISKSLLGSIIICKECGWEWEIKEGGEDPYICHKCGYNNSLEKQKMSKQSFQTDDEKKIVLGPAMIPDFQIFRKDGMGNPYYVYFTAKTIKMICDKYMRNKYTDNNDQMHDGKAVKDVYVVESWIKESENDKSTDYGYGDLPIGTWFVSMKVNNPEIWAKVKEGFLNGFSVSGYFEEVAQFCMEEMFLKQVVEILNNIED
jgi:hypothetical protein